MHVLYYASDALYQMSVKYEVKYNICRKMWCSESINRKWKYGSKVEVPQSTQYWSKCTNQLHYITGIHKGS